MKKNFAFIFVILCFLNNICFAQTSENPLTNDPTNAQPSSKDSKKSKWQDKYNKASPEQKAKMTKRREIIKNLTPEQRELFKKEQQRHREEIQKITGHDIGNYENQ